MERSSDRSEWTQDRISMEQYEYKCLDVDNLSAGFIIGVGQWRSYYLLIHLRERGSLLSERHDKITSLFDLGKGDKKKCNDNLKFRRVMVVLLGLRCSGQQMSLAI